MGKWEMVRLGDVATYVNGYAFKPSDWGDSGLQIIRIQDLTGNTYTTNFYNGQYKEKYKVKDGDVLISWSASLGVYEWCKGDALLNQHIFKVVFDKIKVDKKYFMFAVNFLLDEMGKETHGSTMKHITKPRFDSTQFPLPPLDEQKRIAKNLDLASEIVKGYKKQLAELDKLVQSLFYEMFGDPVTNEKGWEIGTIRDVVREVKYGTSRPATEGGKYPYLRMNNITSNGHLDLSNLKQIDIPDNELEKCIVTYGDVLFNRTNSKELVGKTCVYNLQTKMIIAGYIIRVRVNKKMIPEFLSAILNSKYGKNTLYGICKSIIGQANINAQELQDINIYVPPIQLQTRFASIVTEIESQKAQIQKGLSEAENLFNSLMQEYFE